MQQIAVFASGEGTNFEAIASACERKELNARVALLVCDKPNAPCITRAKKYGIPTFAFSPKDYANKSEYEAEIVALLDKEKNLLSQEGGRCKFDMPCWIYAHRR